MGRPKKRKQSILEDDGEAEEIDTLTVNEEYARRFKHNKERDDLHRLKELQKAGLAGEEESDSEDESEDEDGLLPEETEAQIFETLTRIRQKDPSIYQKDVAFFKEGGGGGGGTERSGDKKQKAVYLKDVVAQQLLEGGGAEEDDDQRVGLKRKGKTYVQEQEELKNEFLKGIGGAESDDEEEDDLLRVRKGPSDAATSALASAPAPKDNEVMARLEAYFGKDDALDEGERFLKDYLANRKWVDKDADRVPTYGEIVDEQPDASEDEEEVERQEEFEKQYNFRFEEPGAAHVVGYARAVEGSVRRPDDARKRARQQREERAAAEAAARKEELKRLKNIKKKELQEKLERIKEMAGSLDGAKVQQLVDLDDDFDPAAYDKQMREMFGEEYYEGGEEDDELLGINEDEGWAPPEDDEDEIADLPAAPRPGKAVGFKAARMRLGASENDTPGDESAEGSEGEGSDEEGGEEASDEEGGGGEGEGEGGEDGGEEEGGGEDDEERQRAYRVLQEDKQAFEKKLEEYYKLDYEDVVGDLPTRFKYAQVKSNTFGLQTDDILAMDDKELNALVSLKNIAPYRPDEWRLPKWAKAKLRLSRKERKKKALEHHGAVVKRVKKGADGVKEGGRKEKKRARDGEGNDGEKERDDGKKEGVKEKENGRKGEGRREGSNGKEEKKKRKREQEESAEGVEEKQEAQGDASADGDGKKKRKRRKKKGGAAALGLSESRLQSYGQLTVPGKKAH